MCMVDCFQFCINFAFKFDLCRYTMEPILRTSVPPIVSWIGFEKISLAGWWPLRTPRFRNPALLLPNVHCASMVT